MSREERRISPQAAVHRLKEPLEPTPMLLQLGPKHTDGCPITADLGLAESDQDRLDVRSGIVVVCMPHPADLHQAASSLSASTHSYY
jgi:hypothetical protein